MTVLEGTIDDKPYQRKPKRQWMDGWHRAADGTEVTTTGDKWAEQENGHRWSASVREHDGW